MQQKFWTLNWESLLLCIGWMRSYDVRKLPLFIHRTSNFNYLHRRSKCFSIRNCITISQLLLGESFSCVCCHCYRMYLNIDADLRVAQKQDGKILSQGSSKRTKKKHYRKIWRKETLKRIFFPKMKRVNQRDWIQREASAVYLENHDLSNINI